MKTIYKISLLHSTLAVIHIVLVGLFMNNAEKIFGPTDSVISGTVFLILFTLSAVVVGGLIVGRPVMLYIDGKKKEAVLSFIASGIFLLIFFLIALLILALT